MSIAISRQSYIMKNDVNDDSASLSSHSDSPPSSVIELSEGDRRLLDMKPNQLSPDDRKRRRKIQNRLAAQESRGRKKQHVSCLQEELLNANNTISDLKEKMAELTNLLISKNIPIPPHIASYISSKVDGVHMSASNIACFTPKYYDELAKVSTNSLTSALETAKSQDAVPSLQLKQTCKAMLEEKNIVFIPNQKSDMMILNNAMKITPEHTSQHIPLRIITGNLMNKQMFQIHPSSRLPLPHTRQIINHSSPISSLMNTKPILSKVLLNPVNMGKM